MYVRTENGDLLTEKKAIRVRFLAGDYLRGVSLQTSGVTTTSACLAGSIPVLYTIWLDWILARKRFESAPSP